MTVDSHNAAFVYYEPFTNDCYLLPNDTVQLAGIVPVIPGEERLNGYLLADAKGRKLIHVNIHGHFRKVRVSMENGDDFARPVQELDFISLIAERRHKTCQIFRKSRKKLA